MERVPRTSKILFHRHRACGIAIRWLLRYLGIAVGTKGWI
jgi:hypothetical protein